MSDSDSVVSGNGYESDSSSKEGGWGSDNDSVVEPNEKSCNSAAKNGANIFKANVSSLFNSFINYVAPYPKDGSRAVSAAPRKDSDPDLKDFDIISIEEALDQNPELLQRTNAKS